MGLLQALRAHLLYMAVLLAILAYTPYYLKWKQREADLKKLASESPFFVAHVLDPSVEGLRHTSWNRDQWINWLRQRESIHARVNKNSGRIPLTDKGINSILITTTGEFLNSFEGRRFPYYPNVNSGGSDHTYWGETPFSSYVFLRQGKNFRIYKCPPMYIAVKFVGDKPIHLPITARKKDARERVKVSKDCVVVN